MRSMHAMAIGRAILGLLAAPAICAAGPADSPQEFRAFLKEEPPLTVVELTNIPRPYAQVAEQLRKKVDECLSVTILGTRSNNQGNLRVAESGRTTFTGRSRASGAGLELTVQVMGGRQRPTEPKYGKYILVADAVPVARNMTKLTVYKATFGPPNWIGNQIRGWAKGATTDCPDLR